MIVATFFRRLRLMVVALIGLGSSSTVLLTPIPMPTAMADEPQPGEREPGELHRAIKELPSKIELADGNAGAINSLGDAQRVALMRANQASRAAWQALDRREAWQAFREQKLQSLRASLVLPNAPTAKTNVQVVGRLPGDGFYVERLLFESRPGWWVTANRYLPDKPPLNEMRRPGMLIAHAHHTPKEHAELQDMGMTWARAGAVVLVPDQLGHGERRQHGIAAQADGERAIHAWDDLLQKPRSDAAFRTSRQDYYFRYDNSLRLYLAGESLMGWMVWDLMRAVDVLIDTPQVHSQRIVLLGAVAGGGDPAAVTAALDERIAVAVPFNFGGPQPETRYPLPDDVESTFAYAGSGSWESTRNLARSAAEGFLPWVIVGSIAPRQLIVGHEFSWDQTRDPVWKRWQQIYQWYDRPAALAFTHGKGELKQNAPQASHCTHIGPLHRVNIHAALNRWFDWSVSTASEYSQPRPKSELLVWDQATHEKLQPQSLSEQLLPLVDRKLAAARQRRAMLAETDRVAALKAELAQLFGWPKPDDDSMVADHDRVAPRRIGKVRLANQVQVERLILRASDQVPIPLIVLQSTQADSAATQEMNPNRGSAAAHRPVVLAIAHGGKSHFLRDRTGDVEQLLLRGYDVVIPDLRGMGQNREDDRLGRTSSAASRWANSLMLGEPLLGQRLRDLQIVINYVRACPEYARSSLLLWGDTTGVVNPSGQLPVLPHDAPRQPFLADADGPTLAILAAIFDERIQAIFARGAILDWRSTLQHAQSLVSVELVVPGWLSVTDGDDLCAALAPRPLAQVRPINGLNQLLTDEQVRAALPLTLAAYQSDRAPVSTAASTLPTNLQLAEISVADWFQQVLTRSTK